MNCSAQAHSFSASTGSSDAAVLCAEPVGPLISPSRSAVNTRPSTARSVTRGECRERFTCRGSCKQRQDKSIRLTAQAGSPGLPFVRSVRATPGSAATDSRRQWFRPGRCWSSGANDQHGELGQAVGADQRIAALAHQVALERLTTRVGGGSDRKAVPLHCRRLISGARSPGVS